MCAYPRGPSKPVTVTSPFRWLPNRSIGECWAHVRNTTNLFASSARIASHIGGATDAGLDKLVD